MIKPLLSTEAVLKEALLATLKWNGDTRRDMWEPACASIIRRVRTMQASRPKS
jgi:hypothetical protein